MPTVVCQCGAKYKVAESALGKRARCKKCGQVFSIETDADSDKPVSLADLTELARGETQERVGRKDYPTVTSGRADPALMQPQPPVAEPVLTERAVEARGGLRAYFAALPQVFAYPTRIHNLSVLLVAWIVLTVGFVGASFLVGYGSVRSTCLGTVVFLLAEGAFAALSFNTVHQSAQGERELPVLPLLQGIDEWWAGMIVPLFGFLLTCAIALAPAIAYAVLGGIGASRGAPVGLPDLAAFCGLLAAGLFLWPMLVLAFTLGDFKALVRFGPMAVTAIQTFPAYVCTLVLIYGCAAVVVFLGANLPGDDASAIVVAAVILGVRVYLQLAAMRAIGTYYRCYQSKFEWL
jgi:hypothetical protein